MNRNLFASSSIYVVDSGGYGDVVDIVGLSVKPTSAISYGRLTAKEETY